MQLRLIPGSASDCAAIEWFPVFCPVVFSSGDLEPGLEVHPNADARATAVAAAAITTETRLTAGCFLSCCIAACSAAMVRYPACLAAIAPMNGMRYSRWLYA